MRLLTWILTKWWADALAEIAPNMTQDEVDAMIDAGAEAQGLEP